MSGSILVMMKFPGLFVELRFLSVRSLLFFFGTAAVAAQNVMRKSVMRQLSAPGCRMSTEYGRAMAATRIYRFDACLRLATVRLRWE